MTVPRLDLLTERQRECLRLTYTHHSAKQIAVHLGISVDGVKWHLGEARKVLGVNRSTDAARLVFGDFSPSDYSREVVAPSVVDPVRDPVDQRLINEEGDRHAGSMLRDAQSVYTAGSSYRGSLRAEDPHAGEMRNDLTWHKKLLLGILIGFIALAGAGAAVSLQNALH